MLSLRLGFLCPKLSTQGAITCSPKLHYSVSLDQPANSFLRSTDSALEMMDLPQAAYNLWTHQGRLGLLWPCLGYAHLLSLLRDSISAQHFARHRGFSASTDQGKPPLPGQGNPRGCQTDLLMDEESKFIPGFQARFLSTPLLLPKRIAASVS